MFVKVFGIQRTGTNYLARLINKNLIIDDTPVLLEDPGWKHGPIQRNPDIDKEKKFKSNNKAVILIKNPYTWYTSIQKWIKPGRGRPYDGFKANNVEYVFRKFNVLYNEHRKFLLGDNDDTVYTDSILIRYEDLLIDPPMELSRISEKFGYVFKHKFTDLTKVAQSGKFTDSMRKYYIAQRPLYDNKTIELVTSVVDWELMKFYGYEKIVL